MSKKLDEKYLSSKKFHWIFFFFRALQSKLHHKIVNVKLQVLIFYFLIHSNNNILCYNACLKSFLILYLYSQLALRPSHLPFIKGSLKVVRYEELTSSCSSWNLFFFSQASWTFSWNKRNEFHFNTQSVSCSLASFPLSHSNTSHQISQKLLLFISLKINVDFIFHCTVTKRLLYQIWIEKK